MSQIKHVTKSEFISLANKHTNLVLLSEDNTMYFIRPHIIGGFRYRVVLSQADDICILSVVDVDKIIEDINQGKYILCVD